MYQLVKLQTQHTKKPTRVARKALFNGGFILVSDTCVWLTLVIRNLKCFMLLAAVDRDFDKNVLQHFVRTPKKGGLRQGT